MKINKNQSVHLARLATNSLPIHPAWPSDPHTNCSTLQLSVQQFRTTSGFSPTDKSRVFPPRPSSWTTFKTIWVSQPAALCVTFAVRIGTHRARKDRTHPRGAKALTAIQPLHVLRLLTCSWRGLCELKHGVTISASSSAQSLPAPARGPTTWQQSLSTPAKTLIWKATNWSSS